MKLKYLLFVAFAMSMTVVLLSCQNNVGGNIKKPEEFTFTLTQGDAAGSIKLEWTVGSAIVTRRLVYVYKAGESFDDSVEVASTTSHTTTEITISGLTSGITYYVWMKVNMADGTTISSSPQAIVVP